LPCDDLLVIEGMNKAGILPRALFESGVVGFIVVGAVQDYFRSVFTGRGHFAKGGGTRHPNFSADSTKGRMVGDALTMVASRRGDDSPPALVIACGKNSV
jgi:hypothetical protein